MTILTFKEISISPKKCSETACERSPQVFSSAQGRPKESNGKQNLKSPECCQSRETARGLWNKGNMKCKQKDHYFLACHFILFFEHKNVSVACVSVHHVLTWCLQRSEGVFGNSETGVTDQCESPCKC